MIKIAFAQMSINPGNIEKNFLKMKEIVLRSAKLYNADLVIFPELAIQGAQKDIVYPDESYINEFRDLAKENDIWIIPGSLYVKESDSSYNRLYVIRRDGNIVGKFDKIFPWEPFEPVDRGDEILVFDFEGKLKIGIGICYDLFFPELARAMTLEGAELLIYPHYTTTSDRDAELHIARAYSILNSSYVVTFNGVDNYLVGKSAIFGPEGELLQMSDGGEIILTETFERERVKNVRKSGLKGVTKNYEHFLKYRKDLSNIIKRHY